MALPSLVFGGDLGVCHFPASLLLVLSGLDIKHLLVCTYERASEFALEEHDLLPGVGLLAIPHHLLGFLHQLQWLAS